MITIIGTLILEFIVHMILFSIYKLRLFIQRRLFAKELISPAEVTEQQENGNVDSQI